MVEQRSVFSTGRKDYFQKNEGLKRRGKRKEIRLKGSLLEWELRLVRVRFFDFGMGHFFDVLSYSQVQVCHVHIDVISASFRSFSRFLHVHVDRSMQSIRVGPR